MNSGPEYYSGDVRYDAQVDEELDRRDGLMNQTQAESKVVAAALLIPQHVDFTMFDAAVPMRYRVVRKDWVGEWFTPAEGENLTLRVGEFLEAEAVA